ncbi:hypothetical protein [Actinomadura macrotermitis]|uniref:Uncharacterized protein n=1 Tax=Actinomadura macrotermitis TaxID=2585200 RepID=A0A7K0BRH9_9ACTN|nr:hypothetical protein [Actinomadura macrotermitis]MQY03779.1 hypothetical protein [Actinomadura macrotermitis]
MSDNEAPAQPPAPGRRSIGVRTAIVIAVATVVALSAAIITLANGYDIGAGLGVRPFAAKVSLRGTVTMPEYSEPTGENWVRVPVDGCVGIGGFDDMAEGTAVTVYDPSSKVIAVGNLGAGVDAGTTCSWPLTITGVPDLPFYQIEVSHRGKVTVQRADIGSIRLTLG